jgi:hypothetical protein
VLERAVSLGSVGRPLATWFLAATIILIGVAAFAALQALLPGSSRRISTSEFNRFLAERFFDRPRVDIRFLRMEKIIEQLHEDRKTNEKRVRWLRFGFASLAVALAMLVLHVGVFLERAVESPCAGVTQSQRTVSSHHVAGDDSFRSTHASGTIVMSAPTGESSTGTDTQSPTSATFEAANPQPADAPAQAKPQELPEVGSESCPGK